jgi:hypothetical protein
LQILQQWRHMVYSNPFHGIETALLLLQKLVAKRIFVECIHIDTSRFIITIIHRIRITIESIIIPLNRIKTWIQHKLSFSYLYFGETETVQKSKHLMVYQDYWNYQMFRQNHFHPIVIRKRSNDSFSLA